MIRTDSEYQEAIRRSKRDVEIAEMQRVKLMEMGLSGAEIETAMEPLLSFQEQLLEEIAWYENARQRHFAPAKRLTEIGRLLIALRLANGLTQRQLAERLGVNESAVSRDEKNEYHGVTFERAQRILDALQESVTLEVRDDGTSPSALENMDATPETETPYAEEKRLIA
jgi:transcriptional regulator with XRE-family HTH domain